MLLLPPPPPPPRSQHKGQVLVWGEEPSDEQLSMLRCALLSGWRKRRKGGSQHLPSGGAGTATYNAPLSPVLDLEVPPLPVVSGSVGLHSPKIISSPPKASGKGKRAA